MKQTTLYDGTVEVIFNPASTYRYRANGEVVPGVTSVLRLLDKPLLKQWAADKASQFWLDHADSQDISKTAMHELARKEWTNFSTKAADFGTFVHHATEVYDATGNVPPLAELSDELRLKAADMIQRYIDWRTRTKYELICNEEIVYSKKHKYAGTVDRVFKAPDGRLILADIKTSKISMFNQKGVYDDYLPQLGGYSLALKEMGYDIQGMIFINPDKDWDDLRIFELDAEAVSDAEHAWSCIYEAWKAFNKCKYHSKKQNELSRKQWFATHKRT